MSVLQSEQKYLINAQDGANNLERATISYILAVSSSKTCETVMFVSAEASQFCIKGAVDGLVSEGLEPIADLQAAFIENGGKIWICPACVRSKGIAEDDLIAGVEIAGAPRAMEFLANGAKVLA